MPNQRRDAIVVRATHRKDKRRSVVLYVTTDPWVADRMVLRLRPLHPQWNIVTDTAYTMPNLGGGGASVDWGMSSAGVYYPAERASQLPHAPMLMRGRHVSSQPLSDKAQMAYQLAGKQTGVHHLFMTAVFGRLPPPISVYCAVTDAPPTPPRHLLFTNLMDMDGAADSCDVKMYMLHTIRNMVACASDKRCSRIVIHTRIPEATVRLLISYFCKSKRRPSDLRVDVHTSLPLVGVLNIPEVRGFDRPKSALEYAASGVLNVYDQPPGLFVGSSSIMYDPPVPVSVFGACNPNINPHVTYRIV